MRRTIRKIVGNGGIYCNMRHKNFVEICNRIITWNDEDNDQHCYHDGRHDHSAMRLHGQDRDADRWRWERNICKRQFQN